MKGKHGTFEKLEKTSKILSEAIQNSFLDNYGIAGISFGNEEQVYNPLKTGLGTMKEVREMLLENGMKAQYADLLAAKYLKKIED